MLDHVTDSETNNSSASPIYLGGSNTYKALSEALADSESLTAASYITYMNLVALEATLTDNTKAGTGTMTVRKASADSALTGAKKD